MSDLVAAIRRLEANLTPGSATDAAGYYELGGLKLAAGDPVGAVAAYRQCLADAAPSAELFNNLGTALIKAGRHDEAIGVLESALELRPGYTRALVNLGKALRETGRVDAAVQRLREALVATPDYVPALVNLGDALAALGALAAAEQVLVRAVELEPVQIEARVALGIVRLQAGRQADGLLALRDAVKRAPKHADAHSALGHALFVGGDWAAAWPHFEHRFKRQAQRAKLHPPHGVERWDGRVTAALELWLLAEQGLGDQLQFARYARLLGNQGVRCVIACDPRLVRLLSRAQLGGRVVPLGTPIDAPEAQWLPLMSLPAWHATRPDTVPHADRYLAAEPQRVALWRKRLPAGRLRVGLCWAGNPRMETGRHAGRSPPLAALAPLFGVPDVRFISLQKGAGEDQIDAVPFGQAIVRLADLDSGNDAFMDTAAVLDCIDLLITSDTAIAHLGGGLGVPTWLCLMHEPDWRWMLQGASTPWYRSMRLFRQRVPGDWAGVYREVAAALAAWPR